MREALDKSTVRKIYDKLAARYDFQHNLLTAGADQRARKILVKHTVQAGDRVLDCGAGTGSASLLAAASCGASGNVTLVDISENMLNEARKKMKKAGFDHLCRYEKCDMTSLPFENCSFDVVLSAFSLCPVYDPYRSAGELFRVLKPGGLLGVAHSVQPENRLIKSIADRVENFAWRFHSLSMGCRAINILPTLQDLGGIIILQQIIGPPLWPFCVIVVKKPDSRYS